MIDTTADKTEPPQSCEHFEGGTEEPQRNEASFCVLLRDAFTCTHTGRSAFARCGSAAGAEGPEGPDSVHAARHGYFGPVSRDGEFLYFLSLSLARKRSLGE